MNESREFGRQNIQSKDKGLGTSASKRSISSDAILSAVANEDRRAILNVLREAAEQTLAYEELVNRVAERVRDEGAIQELDEHRQRVRIALHHIHLPMLAASQIIDYEAEAGHVEFVGDALEQDILSRVESRGADD